MVVGLSTLLNKVDYADFSSYSANGPRNETQQVAKLGSEVQLIQKQTEYIKETGHKPSTHVSYNKLLDVY